jgi:hypothetical protein
MSVFYRRQVDRRFVVVLGRSIARSGSMFVINGCEAELSSEVVEVVIIVRRNVENGI